MTGEVNNMTLLTMKPLETSDEQARRARSDYAGVSAALREPITGTLAGVRLAIVGGGIVGLVTALYACRAGAAVELFEAKSLGGAASGRNAGGIYANGRDMGEVALARVSMELWAELDADGLDVKFRRRGHTIVALNDYECSLLERAEELYALAGMPVALERGAAAVAQLPFVTPRLAGALFSPADGQGYPFTAVTSVRDAIRAAGGVIHEHTPVVEVLQRGGRAVGVRTARGRHDADQVLLATGPWTQLVGDQLGVHLPVRPRRSQLTVTERLSASNFPFVSGNRVYARQTHAENILIGGGGPWEENGFHTETTRQALGIYGTFMTEMFPGLARTPIIRAFAGTVELTPDHYPLLGPVEEIPGLWVSAGYNGHGYGLSAAGGRLLVELLRHEHASTAVPDVVAAALTDYSPARFRAIPQEEQ